jgi:signal transduction histidine kinase
MRATRSPDRALPWFVLGVFVVLTVLATWYVWTTTRTADRARFDNAVQGANDALAARLDTYVNVLTATRGLIVADPALRRETLAAYVRGLNVQQRYPGIQGVGMTLRIPPDEVARIVEEMRRSGHPEFRVWPEGPRGEVHSIVMLEPQDRRNRAAIGYDMSTDPIRREAMERARDSGRPAASGRVTLVQEIDPRKQPGFLIYTPLYATGFTPETVEERRAALVGFIYAPFRAYDLLRGIFGRQQRPEVGFQIRDRGELLFETTNLAANPRFVHDDRIVVAGRAWDIRWISRREGKGGAFRLAVATFIGGMVIGLLLFTLLRTQLRAREVAERTAEQLRESEAALQQANTAKDDFLATLSHELRTPMTAIMGWAQMLDEEQLDPATQELAVDSIRSSSSAQAQLIDDLLDVSRITAGKLRIDVRPIDLEPVVRSAVHTMRAAADAKQLRLETDLETDVRVKGDPHRLQQVVWNLLANAVKFTPEGGRVAISLAKEGRDAVIEVRDTGLGIEPRFMPYLFERFRQADSSATRRHMGLGLGLAIVRHLIELHGGTVAAESRGLDHGSTFRVRIPLIRESAEM